MYKSALKLAIFIASTSLLSACAVPKFGDFEKKHKDLSLEQLLDVDNLSADKRQLLETTMMKQAALSSMAGDHNLAARHARMSLQLNPDDIEAQKTLANALLGMGKYAEAEKMYTKLAETSPEAEVSQGMGLVLLAQAKPEEAQTWLNDAVKLDPELWRSWNGLGVIYDMSQTWRLSEQAFKAGLAIAGQNVTLNNNLGLSYLRQNRLQEAIIAFENVRALPGGTELSDMNYRTALALSGEMGMALEGAQDTQVAQLYNNLGVRALNEGDNEKAIEYFKIAISKSPSYYANAVKNLEIATAALP